MKVDLSEFDTIGSYKSLNKLFTRELKIKRDIDKNENSFISPCDSLITELGDMFISRTMQIKGFYYKIDELFTKQIENKNIKKLYNGKYINFYLSPKDYHRYHSPVDMRIVKAVHIPGLLYPVNLKYLNKVWDLFIKNERVILECRTNNDNLFFMVFIGALNVGKIKFNFDERISTNCKKEETTSYIYGDLHIKKGEELGRFEMGSTIVMFFEKNSIELLKDKTERVNFGEIIAKFY
jgi:phosphatidylserine decarboxylase